MQKFNKLTIIDNTPQNGKVLCRCDCGIEKWIRKYSVTSGKTKSCGCLNRKSASERITKTNKKYSAPIKHPIYNSWKSMKTRKIACSEWENNYQAFYDWSIENGWEKGLVLHRHNTSILCCPSNCFWGKRKGNKNQDDKKRKQTSLQKYGVEHYSKTQEYKDRYKQTCFLKYGTEYHTQNSEVKQRIENTNIKRYGVSNPAQSDDVKTKIKNTCLDRYGTACPLQNPDIKQKAIDSCVDKHGRYPYTTGNNKEQNTLGSFLGDSFSSNHTVLNGQEIDFYNEELSIGFEYCGLHWHHEMSPEPRLKTYHYDKYKKCLEKGIRLVTIFSDEWLHKQQQVKGYIASLLNRNEKIYARKCCVKMLEKQIGKKFIQDYHIQGAARSSIVYFGIVFEDELYGVLSLNYHQRNSDQIVLDRLVFKPGFSIVGGSSKLLKVAENWCLENGVDNIITWSDNRWSYGNVYYKMGFDLETELEPDYSYVKISNPKQRFSKQSMMKSKTGCPKHITERDWCLSNGYARIWDCGKKRFKKSPLKRGG